MRIHSGQCEKMGRSGTPHCKDISTTSCLHHHHHHTSFSLPTDLGCEAEHHVKNATTHEHDVSSRESRTRRQSREDLRESTQEERVSTRHVKNTQTHSEVPKNWTEGSQEDRVNNRNLKNAREKSESAQQDCMNTRKHCESTLGEHYQRVRRMAPRQAPPLWHPHQDECHRNAWHCVLGVPSLPSHPAVEELILEPGSSKPSRTRAGAGGDDKKNQPHRSYPGDASSRSSKGNKGSSQSSSSSSSSRIGHRVRLYRKRVCVRLGSLQWSLALVLVVRSRPTATTNNTSFCHNTSTHALHHHSFSSPTNTTTTSARTLPVA